MVKKRCPKCGAKQFVVSAHVVQDWLVDENGKFIECRENCVEVAHKPDDEDIWECNECGHSAAGSEFNVE